MLQIMAPRTLALVLAASAAAFGPASAQTAPGGNGSITLQIDGIASARGTVDIAVCSRGTFMKGQCEIVRKIPARRGSATLQIAPVPAGTWAIAAYHDENGNGRLDRNGLGIPVEGGGFSRNARGKYGPPGFDAAAIQVAGPTRAALTLQY